MCINKIITCLSKVELFQGIPEEELALFAAFSDEKHMRAGEVLFREDDLTDALYIVASGSIQLLDTIGNEEQSLTVFSSNEFIGETVLIAQEHQQGFMARAISDVLVYVFPRLGLISLLENNGKLALKMTATISQIIIRRMENANGRYESVSSMYQSIGMRNEKDLLGTKLVPANAYYGIQTLRARENFDISGIKLSFYPDFIRGLAKVKKAAACANFDNGNLSEDIKDSICQACDEICMGMLQNQFIVDMMQGGAGTSTNMNINEVVANRALEIMGKPLGAYEFCHPNNHVNQSQSTNDAYPTAIKVSLLDANDKLIVVLRRLISAFDAKSFEFNSVLKMGRTQLQDAVPMSLGQSFKAFSSTLKNEVSRLTLCSASFLEVNMGGTAIGTGINAEPLYRERVVCHLSSITGRELRLADDLIEATHDTGAMVMYSSSLKQLAVKLSKICNDLRLLSSGPRAGFNEINLPPMQPGSSIMPGKVNPVIPEVVNQIAFKVIGNDLTVTLSAEAGQLELNVMEPVMIESIFESIEMLKNGMSTLDEKCIRGITANADVCEANVKNSIGIVTALNPYLGYGVCTELAKEALETGASIYDLVLKQRLITKLKLDDILSPANMIG